jgi:hypothetical protein
MEKLEKEKGEKGEEFTTFEDVFALALANTQNSRFKADSNEWHKVIYKVYKDYVEKIPQLRVIFFRERPPLPPQSKEFYQLITTLSMSGLITLPNPSYEYIVMENPQKERARALENERLEKYKDYIGEIAALLDKHLAVKG